MSAITIEIDGVETEIGVRQILEALEGEDEAVAALVDGLETKPLVVELSSRIRSYRDGTATDVLDAFDDHMIEEETNNRHIQTDSLHDLSSWDAESLRFAILNDDGRRVVDLMRPLVGRVI